MLLCLYFVSACIVSGELSTMSQAYKSISLLSFLFYIPVRGLRFLYLVFLSPILLTERLSVY